MTSIMFFDTVGSNTCLLDPEAPHLSACLLSHVLFFVWMKPVQEWVACWYVRADLKPDPCLAPLCAALREPDFSPSSLRNRLLFTTLLWHPISILNLPSSLCLFTVKLFLGLQFLVPKSLKSKQYRVTASCLLDFGIPAPSDCLKTGDSIT